VVYAFEPLMRPLCRRGQYRRPARHAQNASGNSMRSLRAQRSPCITLSGNRKESPATSERPRLSPESSLRYRGAISGGEEPSLVEVHRRYPNRRGHRNRRGLVLSLVAALHVVPRDRHHLVFVGDSGRKLHCVDADTGRPYWTHDVEREFGPHRWSPMARCTSVTRRPSVGVCLGQGGENSCSPAIDMGATISATPVAANRVLYIATCQTDCLPCAKSRDLPLFAATHRPREKAGRFTPGLSQEIKNENLFLPALPGGSSSRLKS